MILNLVIDENQVQIEVPEDVMADGHDFFDMIDQDMDQGWRMGPEFIENPDRDQRIKIVADRMLGALESNKRELLNLLSGYVVTRSPDIKAIKVNTTGEPLETEILR